MKIGDRVRVGDVPYATLPNPAGTIIKDDHDGYWMVTLDEPGFSLARDEDVPLVVEHEDNLTLMPSFPQYDAGYVIATRHLRFGRTASFVVPSPPPAAKDDAP
jgi:hypothetical protein